MVTFPLQLKISSATTAISYGARIRVDLYMDMDYD